MPGKKPTKGPSGLATINVDGLLTKGVAYEIEVTRETGGGPPVTKMVLTGVDSIPGNNPVRVPTVNENGELELDVDGILNPGGQYVLNVDIDQSRGEEQIIIRASRQ